MKMSSVYVTSVTKESEEDLVHLYIDQLRDIKHRRDSIKTLF